jgi:hypothetical protein
VAYANKISANTPELLRPIALLLLVLETSEYLSLLQALFWGFMRPAGKPNGITDPDTPAAAWPGPLPQAPGLPRARRAMTTLEWQARQRALKTSPIRPLA